MPFVGPPLDRPVDLFRILHAGLQARPDDPAVISAGGGLTWRQLDARSNNVAANLLRLGLEPGDRVASLMPNRADLLVHYVACIKAGLVIVPLNYRYMPPEIDHALEVSGARLIVAHEERHPDIQASERAGTLPLGVITFGEPASRGRTFEELTEPPVGPVEFPTPSPDQPVLIFFTSGSTGKPKGVCHSFETYGWSLATLRAAGELSSSDIALPASSMSHMMGLSLSLIMLAVGGRVVIAHNLDSHHILPLLRAHRPTRVAMLPAALMRLVRDHDATHDDFASIRTFRASGDKVSSELKREFTELTGLKIVESYGMTETGVIAHNPPSGLIKEGSVGPSAPGQSVAIRDRQGREVGGRGEGNLWLKSPSIMAGYWNNPGATAEVRRDGWLDTGDVMVADEDGYLWFHGRRKQIIVHDGSNISPQEVEDALLEHPGVASAGVVGVHDPLHGEDVWAYVTLEPDAERMNEQALIDFARNRVGYKAPETITFLDRMPINATGKVDRTALKRLAEVHLAV